MEQERPAPSKVAIVGFYPHHREEAPFDDPSWEIWGLNEGYKWIPKWDKWFQLHPRSDFARANNKADPNHVQWLQEQTKPIYMQQHFDDIPASVEYPLEEVIQKVGSGEGVLTGSVSEMMGLAILQGFKTIGLWGVEAKSETEFGLQRPGMYYLFGLCHPLGIEIVLPDRSEVMREPIYGFKSLRVGYQEQISQRRKQLEREQELRMAKITRLEGEVAGLKEAMSLSHDALYNAFGVRSEELEKATAKLNNVLGARLEMDRLQKSYIEFQQRGNVDV